MGGNNSRHLPDYDEAVAALGEQEVAKILEGFNRLSVRGELRPSEFRTGFLNCAGPVPEALAEALFNCFDSNSSGSLDVQQFVCGVAVICKGRPEQKLRLLFMVYDTDKDQRLSDRDLKRFAHALSDGRGSGETADAVVNSALKELLAGNSAVNYEKFETWARQHVDSPLVDWIFSLEQRVRAEDEDTTSAWRMRPPAIDRSNSVQEREELQALLDWSETLGIDKDLAKELRGAWHAVAMSSRLGVVERSALLETLPSAPAELVQRFAHAMHRAKTGTVSAREWMQDFAICLQGSLDQRKDLVFRMFADDSGSIPLAAAAELTKWGQAAVSVFSERRPNTEPRNGAGSSSGSAASALAAPRLAKQTSEQWSADSEQIAQALGYVALIDLKMVPPNAREELEIIEKLNENFNPEAPGKTGDLWYLIPARWWKQWLEFTSTGTNSREQGPPSIDNTDLVDARDFLRIGLSEGVDYEVVTQDAWHALVAWYDKCGPALPRKVIEIDGHLELEMYPLALHISRTDQDGQIMLLEKTLESSRTALASEAKQAACALHGIDGDWVLCHRIHQDLEFEEVDESQTLHALHFLDGHQLLLRGRNAPTLRANGHRLPSGKNHGHVGLQNLGNTCYMNAAIQCLVHSPLLPDYFMSEYKLDVNPNSKFGMAGKLAVAFAELLLEIQNARSAGSNVVAPRDFKRIFSDFKPQFAGWKQQDAQEFLSMFLAGLSEDVNRTTQKPYRELKDSEGRPDEEVASEYWQSHCQRERSAVAALFSGQFRSVLRCKGCGYTNHSFEAFSFLPIPIPEHSYRWVTCMVVSASRPPAQHITRVCARVPKQGNINDLLEAAGGMLSMEAQDLVAADVGHGYVARLWHAEKPLSALSDDAQPWIFHTPLQQVKPMELNMPPSSSPSSRRSNSKEKMSPPEDMTARPVIIQLVHRRLRTVERYFYNPYKSELFSSPVALQLPNRCPGWRLYATAWMAVRHLVPDLTEPEEWPFLLSTVKRDGTACAYCSWRQGCLGCSVPLNEEEIFLTSEESIAVDWDASILQQQYKEKFAGHIHDHESVTLANLERKTSISLEQCLSSLVKDDDLTAFCRECTKQAGEFTESPHVKSLRFWACPPLLVLQLKRFHSRSGAAYKLFNEVTFGSSLDLRKFLCDGTKDCHRTKAFVDWHRPLRERSVSDELRQFVGFPSLSREMTTYKLYGVVYHMGGMGSGHYTASVLHDTQWYCFNDDRVYTISEQDVCNANAYLLFYARDDLFSEKIDLRHLFPEEGRQTPANIEQIKRSAWADMHRLTSSKTSMSVAGERYCCVS